jgi:hypothetical protein
VPVELQRRTRLADRAPRVADDVIRFRLGHELHDAAVFDGEDAPESLAPVFEAKPIRRAPA